MIASFNFVICRLQLPTDLCGKNKVYTVIKLDGVCLSVYLYVCLSICLTVCLPACLQYHLQYHSLNSRPWDGKTGFTQPDPVNFQVATKVPQYLTLYR